MVYYEAEIIIPKVTQCLTNEYIHAKILNCESFFRPACRTILPNCHAKEFAGTVCE